ncbi:Uncharacterized protein ALO80_03520 [Pseudomonas caricapapayae]|uniref:Uncharacterized protein n=2 Tax=Pseudomonas caricapapayae TaxID=46678 RepID=A0A0N8QSY7_9PSED|nr:hypothetical protein [Pseudomonas caricapapayae]KPW60102.1 Uncharacterized protein ALO80_03520 [Pseudomonas caricapapayae]RMM07835.1 hypothetical protein ALQ84_02283 [Pseudomonas caricapapayae]RMV98159.1 hypothetical protein ALP01_01531 [Pseudomonas caricapapayae]
MYSPKEESAKKSRKDWLTWLLERFGRQGLELPILEVEGVLKPIPGDPRYLLPKEGGDLIVKVPASATVNMEQGDTITFFIDDVECGKVTYTTPDQLICLIKPEYIGGKTEYRLWYLYTPSDYNTVESIRFLLERDYIAPNEGEPIAAAELPDEVVRAGLTQAYLDSVGHLDVTIPRSSDMLEADRIEISWVPVVAQFSRQNWAPVASKTVSQNEATGKDKPVVQIPSSDIQQLAQGKIGIYFRYIDRTGNLGQFSEVVHLLFDLRPAPENLLGPLVYLAEHDNLIDRADAQLGVAVVILGYDNFQTDDQIEVIWEGISVAPVPFYAFPMYIPINWDTLSKKGPATEREVDVSYNVLRSGSSKSSPILPLKVDFTVAGPEPDPANPGPINDKLPVIAVKSRENPLVDNVLGEGDKGQPARAQLPNNPFNSGDILRLYWGDLRPHVVEKMIGAEGPGDIITFDIPWEFIEAGGYNEYLPVYYSTWNEVNEQESGRISVDVRILDIQGLPDVTFPDRFVPAPPNPPTPIPLINCSSRPWDGIRVNIPFDKKAMAVDDEVVIEWQAYSDTNGTILIDETYFEFSRFKLSADHEASGIAFLVPYQDRVEPIVTRGSAQFSYTLYKPSGQSGKHSTRVMISRVIGTTLCSADSRGKCDMLPTASENGAENGNI